LGYFTVDKDSTDAKLVFNKTVGLKDAWEEKGKKEENAVNNGLKEINKYFKVATDDERLAVEKAIAEHIRSISSFSLLQNAIRKNVNNNKSSLLFANWILKYSDKIKPTDIDTELLHKLYSMSLKSESPFVKSETVANLKNDPQSLKIFENQIS
jgi:glutaminyl-tRNA synthetase